MKRPEEHWVDFVSGNATLPTLPTMIVIKASWDGRAVSGRRQA